MNMRDYSFFFLFTTIISHTQKNDPVQYIGIDRGLPDNAVACMDQDYNRFTWFGTYDGLNRHDGYLLKIFHNAIEGTTSIGRNHITAKAGDDNHYLWIGCERCVSSGAMGEGFCYEQAVLKTQKLNNQKLAFYERKSKKREAFCLR